MNDFRELYSALRDVMLQNAGDQVVQDDAPGSLVLRTHDCDVRGVPGWFGTVSIKKSYVAYHLMPIYAVPQLAEDISVSLAARRQGKSCFNFKKSDEALLRELGELTARCRDHLSI